MSSKENDRRRAMSGDEGACGIDDVSQVEPREYLLNELRAVRQFMNELAVMRPTKPASELAAPVTARSKNRSVKGAPSEYWR